MSNTVKSSQNVDIVGMPCGFYLCLLLVVGGTGPCSCESRAQQALEQSRPSIEQRLSVLEAINIERRKLDLNKNTRLPAKGRTMVPGFPEEYSEPSRESGDTYDMAPRPYVLDKE